MLHHFTTRKFQSDNVNHLIGKLLKERNELLGLYFENANILSNNVNHESRELWSDFGGQLMDYPCRAHLKTYPELERIGGSASIDKPTLAQLTEGVDAFVDFHDRYFQLGSDETEEGEGFGSSGEPETHRFAELLGLLLEGGTLSTEERAELFDNLTRDFGSLGEKLGDRIELEDKLLDLFTKYLERTRQISASMALSRNGTAGVRPSVEVRGLDNKPRPGPSSSKK